MATIKYYFFKVHTTYGHLQTNLSLDRIKATGFVPRDWREALSEYLSNHKETAERS